MLPLPNPKQPQLRPRGRIRIAYSDGRHPLDPPLCLAQAAHKFLMFLYIKNPIQGLTARVLEYEDRPPFVTSERQRPGCPRGIEFGCKRVFVLEPPQTLR